MISQIAQIPQNLSLHPVHIIYWVQGQRSIPLVECFHSIRTCLQHVTCHGIQISTSGFRVLFGTLRRIWRIYQMYVRLLYRNQGTQFPNYRTNLSSERISLCCVLIYLIFYFWTFYLVTLSISLSIVLNHNFHVSIVLKMVI